VTSDSSKTEEASSDSTPLLAASSSINDEGKENTNAFPIVKDNAKNLTDFQQKKAEYFFNVNLGMLLFSVG
jgi:hypothetical protein